MRALFSIVSLLVVLAIVGILAAKQMKTAAPTLDRAASSVPGLAAPTGNVREQSQQLQQRVKSDVSKALEQGAAARTEPSDK